MGKKKTIEFTKCLKEIYNLILKIIRKKTQECIVKKIRIMIRDRKQIMNHRLERIN